MKKIKPIELSEEDRKKYDEFNELMNQLLNAITEASKIPKKYFDNNNE